MIDIQQIRSDFPILNRKVHGKDLVYFDNAATTQKPQVVLDEIVRYYSEVNSNIHRGVHALSQESTDLFEQARKEVQQFIHARHTSEIVFTAGATAGINAIANGFERSILQSGDEVLVSSLEHHANIVPWQMACEKTGAKLRIIPMNDQGELLVNELDELLTDRTRILALNHVSNSLGTVNPAALIIEKAHARGIPVLIDAAQSIQHIPIDVSELNCDFLVFSGHKIYAPTGIGVLYGKQEWLEKLPPYQGGGDMIKSVSFEKTVYNPPPFKFEAGTMNYVGAHALATALQYLKQVGIEQLANYEQDLLRYATAKLSAIEGLRIIGTANQKVSVLSFVMENIHQYDVGMVLDKLGIAVRTGTHCNEPVMKRLGIDGTVRASFSFYNTHEEIDRLAAGLERIKLMFG